MRRLTQSQADLLHEAMTFLAEDGYGNDPKVCRRIDRLWVKILDQIGPVAKESRP